ncbi:MAG: histidine phosphatase family protein [Planctomycetes bacterium]|nr:histidine phosphatase family protein [Planctomycetota bacterium]MBI3845488.1 histidine phosphatase family protein [Planctomycetota bacterium]
MNLIIIRHAIAHEHDPSRWPADRDRPLTDEGTRRFERSARALGRLVPDVAILLASPFVRTWQTAKILEVEARWPSPVESVELESGATPERILKALARHASAAEVAIVGHEPDLGNLCAYLLVGRDARSPFEFKKGAAACAEVGRRFAPGSATLKWLLPPKVLAEVDD